MAADRFRTVQKQWHRKIMLDGGNNTPSIRPHPITSHSSYWNLTPYMSLATQVNKVSNCKWYSFLAFPTSDGSQNYHKFLLSHVTAKVCCGLLLHARQSVQSLMFILESCLT